MLVIGDCTACGGKGYTLEWVWGEYEMETCQRCGGSGVEPSAQEQEGVWESGSSFVR